MRINTITPELSRSLRSLLVVFYLLFGVMCAGCISPEYPDYFSTHYDYKLSLQTTETLYNVTLLIPLPVKNSTPVIGNSEVFSSDFQGNYHAYEYNGFNVSLRPGFTLIRKKVGDAWYIRINADRIPPNARYIYSLGGMDQQPKKTYYLVKSKDPLGNESVFLPKTNISLMTPAPAQENHWGRIEHKPAVFSYTIPIYADYLAPPNARLEIYSHYEVSNGWLQEHEVWISNLYTDGFSGRLTGESHGWQLFNGTLKTGTGYYVDPATMNFE